MSKYNLGDLLPEGMSQAELAKIKLMQKHKSGEMSTDDFAAVGDSNDAAIAAMTSDLVKKEKDLANNVKEDGVINITDPSNTKLTTMQALITGAILKAYPSVDPTDARDFYRQLMDNVKAKRVDLNGLDLGDEFEQFAMDNNIIVKDPRGGVDEADVKEMFDRFK